MVVVVMMMMGVMMLVKVLLLLLLLPSAVMDLASKMKKASFLGAAVLLCAFDSSDAPTKAPRP